MLTEDGSIIQECLNGERDAFGLLVDKYKEGIYAYVYSKLGNFHDAQDVTQEVFIHAYRDLRNLRRWESFVFWLYRIAYARCMDMRRMRARRIDGDFIEDQSPKILANFSTESYRDDELCHSIRECLDSLSETCREVIMLHYFAGMNSKEIARAIGISPTAVRMRLSRARENLRKDMIIMMNKAIRQQNLPSGFTFGIMETLGRIKTPMNPNILKAPWALSLATGIFIAFAGISSFITLYHFANIADELTLKGDLDAMKMSNRTVGEFGDNKLSDISGNFEHNIVLLASNADGEMNSAGKNSDQNLSGNMGRAITVDLPKLPDGAKKLEMGYSRERL